MLNFEIKSEGKLNIKMVPMIHIFHFDSHKLQNIIRVFGSFNDMSQNERGNESSKTFKRV